ncbi:MAG: rhomboid family intramembrane serine protease [Prevotellaceae bacterium]|jgi:membrane associated rhomboid family serine protease|nr:rhomboid family intramembrane serine protease [Prevotellaceae bacterium]
MFNNIPPVVKNLIIINILMMVAMSINENFMLEKFALFYPASPFFKPYQYITYMFMHGGFAHIFFNMYALFLFGSVLERVWGGKKFFIFYMITGLGAAAFFTFVNWLLTTGYTPAEYIDLLRTPTVGASGAVFGLLLGYGMLFPNSVLQLIFPPIAIKAKWLVIIYGGLELVLGFGFPGSKIAHFAHLGGMLFGFILIKYWNKKGRMYF